MIDGEQVILESGENVYQDGVARVRIDGEGSSYTNILTKHISKNIPFILTGDVCVSDDGKRWAIADTWLKSEHDEDTGCLDVDYIAANYGDDVVPVAKCGEEEYGAHPKTEMTFREYLHNLQTSDAANSEHGCLYLKDYHFMRLHPDVQLYSTPPCFSSDWLNEYCCDKGIDDYRFVYIGPRGSWTPFHADVLRSFSWSVNVSGSKRWILYPPGKEELLKDKLGNLPFDVAAEPFTSTSHPSHIHRIEVVQNTGEAIFVPSGWHHQVHNLETTLSINHNWFNGSNVLFCWNYLQSSLKSVQKEISDCRDMDDWHGHCQVLLRAYLGLNYDDFCEILTYIAEKRLAASDENTHGVSDLLSILNIMQQMSQDEHMNRVDNLKFTNMTAKIHKHSSTDRTGRKVM